jgi:hypothetical protein
MLGSGVHLRAPFMSKKNQIARAADILQGTTTYLSRRNKACLTAAFLLNVIHSASRSNTATFTPLATLYLNCTRPLQQHYHLSACVNLHQRFSDVCQPRAFCVIVIDRL